MFLFSKGISNNYKKKFQMKTATQRHVGFLKTLDFIAGNLWFQRQQHIRQPPLTILPIDPCIHSPAPFPLLSGGITSGGRQEGLWAGLKQRCLGSIPLRFSFFFKKVVVCGHSLVVTLSLTINETFKMALIATHLNAGVILVVTV